MLLIVSLLRLDGLRVNACAREQLHRLCQLGISFYFMALRRAAGSCKKRPHQDGPLPFAPRTVLAHATTA
ncbi:MAG: hypothetical protein AB1450_05780 [Pseudomonadota bacterium]